jgi:subtilisin-like proprotein convertase family protein
MAHLHRSIAGVRGILADRHFAISLCISVASLALSQAAHAEVITQIFTSADDPIALIDDAYDGQTASMTSKSIQVSIPGTVQATDINVRVTITHAFVGDLVIKLEDPHGSIINLLLRPGLPGGPDDGTGTGGDSSNLSAAFPISFDDEAISGVLAESMGQGISGTAIIGNTGVNGRHDNYVPEGEGDPLSTLDTIDPNGQWKLYVADAALGQTGTVIQWEITVTAGTIPEPATLLLLSGLSIAGLTRPRRRV